jgi:hypothetical protein
MADKVTKLRRGATATSQKAQKKEGEDKTSGGRRGNPSNHPNGVVVESTSGDRDEHSSLKRQRTADPKMGATSFQQLFADTTGRRRLDDVIDQNFGAENTQQEIHRTDDDLESTNRDGTVQREEVVAEPKEKGPPLFVRGSIKAKRIWTAGFSFEGIDEKLRYSAGKDVAVAVVNKDGEEVYLTADDGITLYTKEEFATYYGKAVLVERDEDNYWSLIEVAKELC